MLNLKIKPLGKIDLIIDFNNEKGPPIGMLLNTDTAKHSLLCERNWQKNVAVFSVPQRTRARGRLYLPVVLFMQAAL